MTHRAALVANFDCERAWVGAAPLPTRVVRRLQRLGPLLAGLVPRDMPWRAIAMGEPVRVGDGEDALPWGAIAAAQHVPPQATAAALVARAMPADEQALWQLLLGNQPSVAAAVAASDRRAIAHLADEIGYPFPGVVHINSMTELTSALGTSVESFVLKPSLTAAGRDRVVLNHLSDYRTFDVARGLLRDRPNCLLEPWVSRTRDVGQVGLLTAQGELWAFAPHEMLATSDGTFVGARVHAEASWLPQAWQQQLQAAFASAAQFLRSVGYAGPFGVDAFAYQTPQGEAFRPLCEINPRLTFGWLAQAWARRLQTTGTLTLRRLPPEQMARATPLTNPAQPAVAWFVPAPSPPPFPPCA